MIARALALSTAAAMTLLAGTSPVAAPAPATPPVSGAIPAIQVDGRGHGHGVGMAQDGALAMGRAGATTKQILGQFYPGTNLGKATGSVRVHVLTGNGVELNFPDGGEVRGYPAQNSPPVSLPLKIAPGGSALVYRDGDGTRVKTTGASPSTAPPPSTSPTTTPTTVPPPAATTTTALIPFGRRKGADKQAVTPSTSTSSSTAPTTSTTAAPQPVALFAGVVTAAPAGGGRIGVPPRHHRYRGVIEMTPVPPNALRFVNQVPVETYLRGMGEVRNPSWPPASLQAQAIAARTYALRAMASGGELCDTQRCQVYLGADAEYAEMDRAVAATAGQVVVFGKSLASAVYSANGGGYSATREEGFGQTGPSYPYLRAAPYSTNDPSPWSITIALRDVASRLKYRGTVSSVEVADHGPSGRATRVTLHGDRGDVVVSGIDFDAALGLPSTLFTLRTVSATKVATLTGGSVLQAPPEQAASLVDTPGPRRSEADATRFEPTAANGKSVGAAGVFALVLWLAVSAGAFTTRRRARAAWRSMLS